MFEQYSTIIQAAWAIAVIASHAILAFECWPCRKWYHAIGLAWAGIVFCYIAAATHFGMLPEPMTAAIWASVIALAHLIPAVFARTYNLIRVYRYTTIGFSWDDSEKLANLVEKAACECADAWRKEGIPVRQSPMPEFDLINTHQLDDLHERIRIRMQHKHGPDCRYKVLTAELSNGQTHVSIIRLPKAN